MAYRSTLWVLVTVVVSFWVGVIFARVFPGGLIGEFTEWVHHWQELFGAVVGASALLYTVWVTLNTERRKRGAEAKAIRVALGSELRLFAFRVMNTNRDVLKLLSEWLSIPNPWANAHQAIALK